MKTALTQRFVAAVRLEWRLLGQAPGGRVMAIAILATVALGLWLRARGFLFEPSSFWLDESAWAIYLIEEPLQELMIRPIGFMAVSSLIISLHGPTEMALRTLPWMAGVAACVLAPYLARRLFSSPAAQLLFVAIIALHPSAQSFAKEFKPYSISLTLHLSLVFLTLEYWQNRRSATLGWLLGISALGTLFAQDVVFAYPGVFLVAGYAAFRSRREHLAPLAGAAVVIVGALLAQYFLIWNRHSSSDSQFWGNKYDTFFVEGASSYFDWFSRRYLGLAAFPGSQGRWNRSWFSKDQWESLRPIATSVWLVVNFVGLVSFAWLRRWREALLLVLPLVVAWLFNGVGFWPFGVFRANLFMLVYIAGIAGMAFERSNPPRRSLLALLPATLLVFAPIIGFEEGWGQTKRGLTYVSRFADVMVWFADRAPKRGKPKQIILLGRGYCDPWRYYLEFHPETSRLKKKIGRGYEARCIHEKAELHDAILAATTSSTVPTWVVRTDSTPTGDLRELSVVARRDFGRDKVAGYVR